MRNVAIVGAGEIGGALAYILARHDTVAAIRLVDDVGSVAVGKALDITQAAPTEHFAARLSGTNDLAAAGGADVIVVADRVGEREWQDQSGLTLLKHLHELAPHAVVLCAGSSQRELVERGVRELHLDRTRLFGSAPEALTSAVRAMIALQLDRSPRDVALAVLGVPPARIVVPWDGATVGGFPIMTVIDEPTKRRLSARVATLWPPAAYALARAAAKAIDVMSGRSRTLVNCFVAPDDSTGVRTRAAAYTVCLGAAGIEGVVLPSMNVVDRVALDNAVML